MNTIKIAFLDIVGLRYDGDTLNKRGLGGSESATIYMARELYKLGFEVTVFCKVEQEGVYDGVVYLSNEKCANNTEVFDALITLRSCVPYIPIEYRETVLKETGYDIAFTKGLVENSKYKALWLHDTFCSGDSWLEHVCLDGYFDEIFTLSDWHTSYILNGHTWRGRIFEVLKDKIFQTRNGIRNYIEEVDISKKDKNLFVYNASVSKGMTPLLEKCWSKIRKNIPDAKLMVIGGYYRGANHDNPDEQELQWMKLKETYHGKDGVYFTGIISQKEIAEILSKAALMVYPCAFPETFGISTLESLNYNTPVVTCKFGALEETAIEKACYLINYDINYDANQVDRFVSMVTKAYDDDYLRKQKMYACNEVKPISTWDTVALQWKEHICNKLGLTISLDEREDVERINQEVQRVFKRRFLNKEDIIEHSKELNNFVIVTPVYNAEAYIEKCINSVANQSYGRYDMIIIDDMSTDNTVQVAKNTIDKLPSWIKKNFKIIENQDKRYAVTNQVQTINYYANCYQEDYSYESDDIIVLLDGDDWLVNDSKVLTYLDNVYQEGCDITYGSCHSLVDNIDLISEPYPKEVIENKTFRNHLFSWGMPYTHLRTFRKSLFNKIDESLFKDEEGNHWKAGGDNALFYPLLENANSIRCIQRVLMVYNDTNPLNDYKVNAEEQTKNANKIRQEVSKKHDITDMRNLKNIYDKVLDRDEESVQLLKDTLINRKDAWLDDINADNIIDRFNWLKDMFEKNNIPKDAHILDIGSWSGAFINEFYKMGYKNISCLDISKEAVRLGKETYPQFSWMNLDIEKTALSEKYDVIIMFEVIEHLIEPVDTLIKIKTYLQKDGFIFFTIPKEEFINKDGMAYEHVSYISQKQLETLGANVESLSSRATGFNWYTGYIKNKQDDISGTPKTKILIGLPTAKNIETDTFKSIYDLERPANTELDLQFFYGYNIDQVRNKMVDYAVACGFDYLFCVDSDIVLPKNALVKLLNHNKDIVSGIYRQRFLDKKIPELYIDGQRASEEQISKPQLLEVDSCGFGCTLISTELIKKIGYPQFEYHSSIDFKDTISEDTDFCIKTRKCGSKVYVDTGIKCGHIGNFELKI
jgi:glycosyltransferase involved in cell wall biosynthesis